MRKYYESHVDFSEIETVTCDKISHENAIEKLTEAGAFNEKGKPNVNFLNTLSGATSAPFFTKLERRLARRRGGIGGAYETFKNLLSRKEYTAMYLYLVILYGFLEWRVPELLSYLPAAPDVLKIFMGEFLADFEEFLEEMAADEDISDDE
jgi:hypothetical protein